MTYSKTFIKQSPSSNIGHIYEHVVANDVVSQLLARGYYNLLDYEFGAHTFDGIIVFKITSRSRRIIRLVTKIMNDFAFTKPAVQAAIVQIECEYGRLAEFDMRKLNKALQELHAEPWTDLKDFEVTFPIEGEAREYKGPAGKFGNRAVSKFKGYNFIYTIEDCPVELKTIAVYLLQVVGLNQVDILYNQLKHCYDIGDEWAEYNDEVVGYLHTLVVKRDLKKTPAQIEAMYRENLKSFVTPKFIRAVRRYIRRDIGSRTQYFRMPVLFANTYQITGTKYVRKMATTDNILRLMAATSLDIEPKKL